MIDESFIETFYNEATQRTAYAHIQNGTHIFGADNTGGWHWHPREKPETHISVGEAITFPIFLKYVEDVLSSGVG